MFSLTKITLAVAALAFSPLVLPTSGPVGHALDISAHASSGQGSEGSGEGHDGGGASGSSGHGSERGADHEHDHRGREAADHQAEDHKDEKQGRGAHAETEAEVEHGQTVIGSDDSE